MLRSLTELHAGLVVAIHDEYLQMASFEQARREHGALERLIAVSAVVSGQLSRILDRRIRISQGGGIADAFTDAAVDELAELNRTATQRNLRATLGVAHAGLVAAVERGAELIDVADVRHAAVEQLGR